MARLSRKLRVCKWVGTVGCALIVAAWMWSGRRMLEGWWRPRHGGYCVLLVRGVVRFEYAPMFPWSGPHLYWERLRQPRFPFVSLAKLPSIDSWNSLDGLSMSLPLWLPFLIVLIPTLLLWRRDRRRPHPGFCRSCGYNLTGNVSGVCPECGKPITEKQRALLLASERRERSAGEGSG